MTIHQLKEPCWELDPNPYGDDEAGIQHFPSRGEAEDELGRLRTERRAADRTRAKQFIDDDAGGSHFGTVDGDLEDYLKWDGWTRTAPDGCRCWDCSPEDVAPLPLSPAELEAAGQMRLPGVA